MIRVPLPSQLQLSKVNFLQFYLCNYAYKIYGFTDALFYSTDSDQPTLQYFNRHVRSLIADKWEEVGVQLLTGQYQKEIKIIKANNNSDVEKCCSSLFDIWIQRQPNDATWRALIEAIRNAHLNNEACKIENMLMSSGKTYTCSMIWPYIIK